MKGRRRRGKLERERVTEGGMRRETEDEMRETDSDGREKIR